MADGRDRYDGIVSRLAGIEEELRDLAFERLQEAAADPDGDTVEDLRREEKRLLQARRAVAKAIQALS
ncbi:MAG: hypothetical protein KatS3mg009_2248 [Acidimicrobiia bacterium]|nr:MAG: hypothetical protein KatS3mg009_2248 [Acidimicrobiia bacterium]